MHRPALSYKRHRFPFQVTAHAVWLYARFSLSLREAEELFLERGGDVSCESARRGTVKFGPGCGALWRRD